MAVDGPHNMGQCRFQRSSWLGRVHAVVWAAGNGVTVEQTASLVSVVCQNKNPTLGTPHAQTPTPNAVLNFGPACGHPGGNSYFQVQLLAFCLYIFIPLSRIEQQVEQRVAAWADPVPEADPVINLPSFEPQATIISYFHT